MSWPLSQEYNEAIQNPASSFADPELRGGEAATNEIGLPMPRSGNFADVYQVHCGSGSSWAVKCFTREVPGLHDRRSLDPAIAQACTGKGVVVPGGVQLPLFRPAVEVAQLDLQHRGLDRVQAEVAADHLVVVLGLGAVIAQATEAVVERGSDQMPSER